ncbi:hypothetical protein GCM10014719_08170 [Planomonospora parontospora subsp. antibiotica]|nr:hypothetical protein GCM10014719_08170 [Planomonospora parontospora subsp. antibiotica]GII14528.1 hypothetical protein Ppa05_12540 [Planomonospora parontospora subsp. antibiotica]
MISAERLRRSRCDISDALLGSGMLMHRLYALCATWCYQVALFFGSGGGAEEHSMRRRRVRVTVRFSDRNAERRGGAAGGLVEGGGTKPDARRKPEVRGR